MPLEVREVGQVSDPIDCPFCGVTVLPAMDPDVLEPWDPSPACAHVWGLWHDHGIAYLSAEARAQMAAFGVLIRDDETLGIDLELSEDPDSEDHRHHADVLGDTIHGPGAVVLAGYSGPPGPEGSYVGVAEKLG